MSKPEIQNIHVDEFHDYDRADDRPLARDTWPKASRCACGGVCLFIVELHQMTDDGDTPRLECHNKRCGRIVPVEGRTVAEAVEKWNMENQQAACVHSWFVQEGGGFRCSHCGKEMEP